MLIKELRREMEELKQMKEDNKEPAVIEPLDKPLTERVRATHPPKKFKMPSLEKYRGATDPVAHVENFREQMILQGVEDDYMYRVFPLTLEGPAMEWFKCLKTASIDSFSILARELVTQFQGAKPPPRDPTTLQYIKQVENESLKDYITKYHNQVMQLGVFGAKETLQNFWRNLRVGRLWSSFEERNSETYQEAYARALKQIQTDEKYLIKRQQEVAESPRLR